MATRCNVPGCRRAFRRSYSSPPATLTNRSVASSLETTDRVLAGKMSLVPTVLHISDLHRTSNPRVRNDELFPAVVSDAARWDHEGIPRPDLIVVSGDLVQGAPRDASDPDAELEAQYHEAGELLQRLVDEFLGGDRSRIVMVPGNHDVHRRRSLDGMKPIDPCPSDIARQSLLPDSGLRWSWGELQAYEVFDQRVYSSRFDHFHRFRRDFYRDVEPDPFSPGDDDLVFFEYPNLDLLVVGFSSWHGNDCFCSVGEIAATPLALAQKLVAHSNVAVRIAVWHHSISGGPRKQDYMDERVVHRLVDFGFTVGMHGHQHHPGAAPFELRLPNRTSMAVVGAGSLAAGDRALPMGERRQFNVLVIEPAKESVTVHVRGMSSSGVFAGFHRADFGGDSFIELPLQANRLGRRDSGLKRIDEATTAVAEGKFDQALVLLGSIPSSRPTERRRIEMEALRGLGRVEDLIEVLRPPQSAPETVELISLLLEAGRSDEAEEALAVSEDLLGEALCRDLRERIVVARESSP